MSYHDHTRSISHHRCVVPTLLAPPTDMLHFNFTLLVLDLVVRNGDTVDDSAQSHMSKENIRLVLREIHLNSKVLLTDSPQDRESTINTVESSDSQIRLKLGYVQQGVFAQVLTGFDLLQSPLGRPWT